MPPLQRIPRHAAQIFALLLPCALTGCPFSDNYSVDPNAGLAGSHSLGGGTHHGGGAGMAGGGASAGAGAAGGSGGASAGMEGATSGTGGTGIGGEAARGGVSGASGGVPIAGEAGQGGEGAEAGAAGMGGEGPCVPEPEICDGKSNDCDDDVDEGGVCPDHCTAQQRDHRVYVLCLWAIAANGPNYATASKRCADMGTELGVDGDFTLAFVESQEENQFLQDWIGMSTSVPDGAVWMGANDIAQENIWVWGQGPNAVQFFRGYAGGGGTAYMDRYNDFGPGRPNSSNFIEEDCGAFDAEVSWQWNDRQCGSSEIGFVCEQQP